VRVGTFNIMHGRSLEDGQVEPDRVQAAFAALDADVLGLQEVDRNQPRSGKLDQAALAAEALGATAYRFTPAVIGTPGEEFTAATGRPAPDGTPEYGVALVSRFPVRRWLVHRLPAAPTRSPVPVGGRVLLLPDEPRAVLAAVVDTPTGPLTVATTHLSFVPGWNARQLRRVVRALHALPGPRMLLGDLNLPAGVARVLSRWLPAARCPTYPSYLPRIQLDHVLVDPAARPAIDRVTTPPAPISDHRPLLVDLTF
jgi:endonuclease/exonuclease/phosphatase family metal-dependent hydrolase